MQFERFDWLRGHGYEALYHAQEIVTITLPSTCTCTCKAKSEISSNIS